MVVKGFFGNQDLENRQNGKNGTVSVAGRSLSKTQNLRPSFNFFRGAATVNLSMVLHPSSLHLCFDSFVSIYFVFFYSHKIEFENR